MSGEFMKQNRKEKKSLRTDLLLEKKEAMNRNVQEEKKGNIIIKKSSHHKNQYCTIYFPNIERNKDYYSLENILVEELKKMLDPQKKDKFLIIGLGNEKCTPDSLGPYTIERVLVTSYLFSLGEVEEGYSNVCSFTPNVIGNTGIETAKIIKSIIEETKANKVIVIDSLKTSSLSRLLKTIQITNEGITPGSGIYDNREEISKKTMKVDVIAIGIPTVTDLESIIKEEKSKTVLKENMIITPTNIDYMIEKCSTLIASSINKCLHPNYIRQNK